MTLIVAFGIRNFSPTAFACDRLWESVRRLCALHDWAITLVQYAAYLRLLLVDFGSLAEVDGIIRFRLLL